MVLLAFWLVWPRRGDRRELRTGVGVLGLVVVCGGARNGANGNNGVGAAGVEGDGVFAVAAAIRGVSVEGASSADEAGSVIRDAVAVGGGGSVMVQMLTILAAISALMMRALSPLLPLLCIGVDGADVVGGDG